MDIYQVQPMGNGAKVVKVGEMDTLHDVRITSFKYKDYHCELVSCLLCLSDGGSLDIVKIMVCRGESHFVGRLVLKFVPKGGMGGIVEIVYGEVLDGEYVVYFVCSSGMVEIDRVQNVAGDKVVNLLVEYLLHEKVVMCLEEIDKNMVDI